MKRYFAGVDLGQSPDYSTIAVVERAEPRGEFDRAAGARRKEAGLRLRMLERNPRGTPHSDVKRRSLETMQAQESGGRTK
jgi:hypothetical protein